MSSVKDDLEGRSPMYLRIALKIMQPSWANSSLPSNDLPMHDDHDDDDSSNDNKVTLGNIGI